MSEAGVGSGVVFASFARRMLAAILDSAVWLIAFVWFVGSFPARFFEDNPVAGGIILLLSFSAWFNYFAIAEWRYGQTIGKNAFGLRVVPVDAGAELSYNAAAQRNLMRLIDFPLSLVGVDWLIVHRSARNQRLGDRVARTVVLRTGPPAARPSPPPGVVAAAPLPGSGAPAGPGGPARAPTSGELFRDAASALAGTVGAGGSDGAGGGAAGGSAGAGGGAAAGPPHPGAEESPPAGASAPAQAPPPGPPGASRPQAGSEPPPEDEGRAAFPYSDWGPKAAIVGVVVAIVGGALLGIPAIIIDNPPDSGDLSTAANVFVQAMTVLGFVVVPLFVASRGGYGPAETLRRLGVRGFRPSAIGWFFAAAGVYLLLTAIYAALITQPKQEDIASSFGPVWVQVFLIVVCAATSEELCFRGMLFSGIRERVPSLGAALISGAIFGGLHVLTGVTAVPPLIVFGTVLALLYERTGSILPAIALHALNNAVALLAQ